MEPIFFYENEFYPFSNFSAFMINWKGKDWMTSEHAYQSEKFTDPEMQEEIRACRSAHTAFKLAQGLSKISPEKKRSDWDEVKVGIMKEILLTKYAQHEYVRKKLKDSGTRELIEDSWRDDFWGWGEKKDGRNQLGKLWMEIREEVLAPTKKLPFGN
jgi:ribA/ribD-fused uncharacterized protein